MLEINESYDLDKCFCCGRNNKVKHNRYWINEEDKSLKLVELVYNCSGCRTKQNKIKNLREQKRKLKEELLDLEFELFLNTY